MTSKTQKLLRSMKNKPEQRTSIASEMYLPNHSGDLSRGDVLTTPTQDYDPVNKKYVDDEIAGITEGLWEVSGVSAQLITSRNVFIQTSKAVFFRDGDIYLQSDADGKLRINADNEVEINSTTLDINAALSLTHANLVTNWLVNTNNEINFRDAAIKIYSNADGEMTIEADSKVTIGVAGDIVLGDSTERDMYPQTTLKVNLGTASKEFNDCYIGGSIVRMDNLPVADPTVAGHLWNDGGTLKVSAG